MALIWRFIQKYDLSEVVDGLEQSGGIDGLLEWMKPRVDHENGYLGFDNFTSHLKDGEHEPFHTLISEHLKHLTD